MITLISKNILNLLFFLDNPNKKWGPQPISRNNRGRLRQAQAGGKKLTMSRARLGDLLQALWSL